MTYTNVKQRKDGTWIGTPVTVERSINDIIPVDNALNESMLNPGILANNSISKIDGVDSNDENDGIASNDENDEIVSNNENGGVVSNDENNGLISNDDNNEVAGNEGNNKINETNSNIDENVDRDDNEIPIIQDVKDGNKHIRKSERIRKQRYEIHPDDIGNNDDEKDKNYKQ